MGEKGKIKGERHEEERDLNPHTQIDTSDRQPGEGTTQTVRGGARKPKANTPCVGAPPSRKSGHSWHFSFF
jgi:hypothetical protein